jgi:hypothetical protein
MCRPVRPGGTPHSCRTDVTCSYTSHRLRTPRWRESPSSHLIRILAPTSCPARVRMQCSQPLAVLARCHAAGAAIRCVEAAAARNCCGTGGIRRLESAQIRRCFRYPTPERWLDENDEARRLYNVAAELKKRFNEAFWMDDTGFIAMALDAQKRQVKSIGSNAGHCLATGIVAEDCRRCSACTRTPRSTFSS